ncbi:hypothetical protein [Streptomyces luteogriseus]|uniref:hypothetical protein n=1 Tax=Streptomyces luteogriseus TaxID=68233 RepID=UPI00378F1521
MPHIGSIAAAALGVLIAGSLTVAAPAAADVSPHCQEAGYCLFSDVHFSGIKAVIPNSTGCKAVNTVGFPAAASVARGFGDSTALRLYSDGNCTQPITYVYGDMANVNPPARSYSLMRIPI